MRTTLMTIAVLLAAGNLALAQKPVVRVVKGGAARSSIDVSGIQVFGGAYAQSFMKVLRSDLEKSGWFTIALPGRATIVVSGSCDDSGSLDVKCRVARVGGGSALMSRSFSDTPGRYVRLAHEVADAIVEAVNGCKGIASTRIVLIGNATGSKELYVCDYDGGNMLKITSDKSVCVSPSWSPDADEIAYTSYKSSFPSIYMISVRENPPTRKRITSFPGLNLTPALSPDGNTMALVLSKDGNPEVYTMGVGGSPLTRVTKTLKAAESSPSWSPDGRRLAYVSDKSGRPQVYIAGRDGSGEKRVTMTGSENVAPDWGPGGLITYCSRREGAYRICVLDPVSGEDRVISSDNANYEDPSWAPDGRHIVCSRSQGYAYEVYVLDTMGDPPVCLTASKKGDWFAPAWSPK